MAIPEQLLQEIQSITASLIKEGICVDQNFPSITSHPGGSVEIGFSKLPNLAATLKNIPYADAYETLSEGRSYNMKWIDGGLIQILYYFVDGQLTKHRLAFFPSPDLLEYQNNSEIYETDERYADIVSRNVVTVPIRFDFDSVNFKEIDHPKSHLTIGQYANCRIPVSAPLTPFHFVRFILRSFYNTPFRLFCSHIRPQAPRFERTIAPGELDHLHLHACG